jgi:hypothetical protein
MRFGRRWMVAVGAAALVAAPAIVAALPFDNIDEEPIRYSASQPRDAVARLQERIDRGEVKLAYDSVRGYLPAILKELKIPVSSQTLVFSKTSLQRDRISPHSPRALYFNDESYVGWVRSGGVMELISMDPQLGAVFYTLDQQFAEKPKLKRETYECLSCHNSTLTLQVPGLTMRSVFPGKDGLPFLQAGTEITTHESPMEESWGGWYVSGTHGEQRHLGNLTFRNVDEANDPNREPGANVTDLRKLFAAQGYLTPHSDLVALMVQAHQTYVHNLITRAGYETRRALQYEKALNRDLGRPADFRSDSTVSRIKSVCEPLLKGLLFSGQQPLAAPVSGSTKFSTEFASAGPKDKLGRSLRQLDLKKRLFRYPCSHLIYSQQMDALPAEAKEYVYRRLGEVLSGKETNEVYAHLTEADRKALREILLETKPELRGAL